MLPIQIRTAIDWQWIQWWFVGGLMTLCFGISTESWQLERELVSFWKAGSWSGAWTASRHWECRTLEIWSHNVKCLQVFGHSNTDRLVKGMISSFTTYCVLFKAKCVYFKSAKVHQDHIKQDHICRIYSNNSFLDTLETSFACDWLRPEQYQISLVKLDLYRG